MAEGLVPDAGRPLADAKLIDLLPRFHASRVLVVGDIILDRYVSGHANRLSPEAPIPVLRPSGRHATLGGAANVALNIAALGGEAVLVGVIGTDPAGTEVQRLLAATDGVTGRVVVSPDRPTTTKTRFIAGTHQLLRLDEEFTAPVSTAVAEQVIQQFETSLHGAAAVVLSDYAKGALSDTVLRTVINRAIAQDIPVIADPKRLDFAAYRGATILTPNELEVHTATRIEAADDEQAERAGAAALALTQGEAVVVTRSEKGLALIRRNGKPLHMPTRARAVADVSGAGDTLVATLALALAAGAELPEAAAIANVSAGISVSKPGTAVVSYKELRDALHWRDIAAVEDKVLPLEEAMAQVAAWRKLRLTVGFTNGCFDLVHPGHVRLLSEARAACDRLIVGLNSDACVRRLKGPARPVQNEVARGTVLASLAAVDLVTIFEDDTPIALIEAIRPDLLVKGADYRMDQVVGADLVKSWGGRVKLVDLKEGHSTTRTISRINRTTDTAASRAEATA
jgi:D-beta-D-heptose 7-phosphate kinase/D-beta-D-heptose 1-phosphate adenosyltransferase